MLYVLYGKKNKIAKDQSRSLAICFRINVFVYRYLTVFRNAFFFFINQAGLHIG